MLARLSWLNFKWVVRHPIQFVKGAYRWWVRPRVVRAHRWWKVNLVGPWTCRMNGHVYRIDDPERNPFYFTITCGRCPFKEEIPTSQAWALRNHR